MSRLSQWYFFAVVVVDVIVVIVVVVAEIQDAVVVVVVVVVPPFSCFNSSQPLFVAQTVPLQQIYANSNLGSVAGGQPQWRS